jgi:fumarate reductase flavoprotein subunit
MAAPVLTNMAGMIPDSKGAGKTYDFIDKKSCDLVVLGGGGSGMVAAVRAAQLTGKKVIVLEKQSSTGGAANYAQLIRTFGSKWQADRNLPDTTTEYARDVMDQVFWRLDEKLVLNCLRGTGQFFDWVCEQGHEIIKEDMFVIGKYSGPGGEVTSGPLGPQMDSKKSGKGFGRFVMDLMKEKCGIYGVEVLMKHPAVDVEVKNGKIVAVIAKSDAGYIRVACEACIMSIGSWINNEAILKKYCPRFFKVKPYLTPSPHMNPSYTGDGIPLAEKVGAFVDYDSFCLRLMGGFYNYLMGDTAGSSAVVLSMSQSPYIITVNLDGKRFAAEPVAHMGRIGHGQVLVDQPHGNSFDIFDESTLAATFKLPKCTQTTEDINTLACYSMTWTTLVGDRQTQSYLPRNMEEVYSIIKKGFVKGSRYMFKADSLEELADQIGVNKKNFRETVRSYNESCEKGVDWNFFKRKDALVPLNKPPYYAYVGELMTDGAFGGVQVNPEMQAYKPNGDLVEGLYITGDFSSSRFINHGGVKIQVMSDLSWALSSGFLAGTNAAKYLQGV